MARQHGAAFGGGSLVCNLCAKPASREGIYARRRMLTMSFPGLLLGAILSLETFSKAYVNPATATKLPLNSVGWLNTTMVMW